MSNTPKKKKKKVTTTYDRLIKDPEFKKMLNSEYRKLLKKEENIKSSKKSSGRK